MCHLVNVNNKNAINNTESNKLSLKIVDKYKDIFEGLGCLKTTCHLTLKPDATPVIEPLRKIPFKLHNDLKLELDKLVSSTVMSLLKFTSLLSG